MFSQSADVARALHASAVGLAVSGVLAIPALGQPPDFYDRLTLRTIQITFQSSTWLKQLTAGGPPLQADLLVDGVTYPRVGVELRGQTSITCCGMKRNLKVTLDAFVPGQELTWGYDKITLDNGGQQRRLGGSVFNEVATLWVMEGHAHAVRANLVQVLAGTSTAMNDLGVYANLERVDKKFYDRFWRSDEGHRYRPSGRVRPFTDLGTSTAKYAANFNVQGGEVATQYADLLAASRTLNNAPQPTLIAAVMPEIQVDSVIRAMAGVEVTRTQNNFLLSGNYYLYQDVFHGNRMLIIPWDLDRSMLTTGPLSTATWFSPSSVPTTPVKRLFTDVHTAERGYAIVAEYLAGGMDWNVIGPDLEALKALATPRILASPHSLLTSQAAIDNSFNQIKSAIRNGHGSLLTDPSINRSVPVIANVQRSLPAPRAGEAPWLTAHVTVPNTTIAEVLLWSRINGAYVSAPMLDNGLSMEGAAGDDVYGAQLPPGVFGDVVEYYIEARPADTAVGRYAFEPVGTELAPSAYTVGLGAAVGPVVINELLADNDNGDVDEFGEHEDWIELHNTGPVPYDVGGHHLTDDLQDPTKWRIPDNTVIQPGGFLRIWADDEPGEGPLHATFKLRKEGESVGLFATIAAGNGLLDGVVFGPQKGDRSYGHVPDGGSGWFYVWSPTGEAPLLAPGAHTRYDGRQTGSPANFDLRASGLARVGSVFSFDLSGGTPGGAVALVIGGAPAQVAVPSFGILGVNLLGAAVVPGALGPGGQLSIRFQVPGGAGGAVIYAQALHQDLSNALTVLFQP